MRPASREVCDAAAFRPTPTSIFGYEESIVRTFGVGITMMLCLKALTLVLRSDGGRYPGAVLLTSNRTDEQVSSAGKPATTAIRTKPGRLGSDSS